MQKLQKKLGYKFNDSALLEKALRHRSASGSSNERLEFIGDSILSFIIATELFVRYHSFREGKLSQLRAALVREETLAELARSLQLGECIQLGSGERKSGGARRESILADAFEAMIGAIYLDAGVARCRNIVISCYDQKFPEWSEIAIKDFKSALQEYLQAKRLPLPHYEMVTTGKAHAQTFEITCSVEGLSIETKGAGSSRQKAEQQAAQRFLEELADE